MDHRIEKFAIRSTFNIVSGGQRRPHSQRHPTEVYTASIIPQAWKEYTQRHTTVLWCPGLLALVTHVALASDVGHRVRDCMTSWMVTSPGVWHVGWFLWSGGVCKRTRKRLFNQRRLFSYSSVYHRISDIGLSYKGDARNMCKCNNFQY